MVSRSQRNKYGCAAEPSPCTASSNVYRTFSSKTGSVGSIGSVDIMGAVGSTESVSSVSTGISSLVVVSDVEITVVIGDSAGCVSNSASSGSSTTSISSVSSIQLYCRSSDGCRDCKRSNSFLAVLRSSSAASTAFFFSCNASFKEVVS